MTKYVVINGGRIVSIFAGPQDPSDKPGYQEITDLEYEEILSQPLSAREIAAIALAQLEEMERRYMLPRVTREALLSYAVAIAELHGVTEAQLYAENPAYKRVKDFDQQFSIVRASI